MCPQASRHIGATASQNTWRGLFPVHPAADVFPMMTDDELDKLGADIKRNGLQQQIVLWQDNGDSHVKSSAPYLVLDGRNRLAAMDRAGIPVPRAPLKDSTHGLHGRTTTVWERTLRELRPGEVRPALFDRKCAYKWRGEPMIPGGSIKWTRTPAVDPAAFVIAANVHRRHLTKEQQADLILRVVEVSEELSATSAEKVEFTPPKPGRPKDPVLQKAVKAAAKQGISRRTVENARARRNGKAVSAVTPVPTIEPLDSTKAAILLRQLENEIVRLVERGQNVRTLWEELRLEPEILTALLDRGRKRESARLAKGRAA